MTEVEKNEEELVEQQDVQADADETEQPTAEGATLNGDGEEPVSEDAEAEVDLSPDAVIQQLQDELAAAEAKANESVDRLQRTAAEFENTRKRQERQLADQIERASGRLVQKLLPILDDFDLAFRNVPSGLVDEETETPGDEDEKNQGAWADGFAQIQKKLLSLLEDEGVTPIPLDGEFDPSRHEAVSSEPNDEVESGHIIETLRVGYEYKGKVQRPAMVRVAM